MGDLRHSFDPVFFTQEEKEQLTARLRQAAEQEDNMKDSTKRAIRHTSHRLIIGVAVAAALTTGALAAAVGGGLMGYFEARTPEEQSTLEEGIYQLNRSETHNGWSVPIYRLHRGRPVPSTCGGSVVAPEGTVLTKPEEDGTFYAEDIRVTLPQGCNGGYSWGIEADRGRRSH